MSKPILICAALAFGILLRKALRPLLSLALRLNPQASHRFIRCRSTTCFALNQ
jgi:hypothetical protein